MIDFFKEQIKKRRRVIRFIISGGTAASINLGLIYLFTDILGFWYLFSSASAFIFAFIVSFCLQKYWTFENKNKDILYKQLAIYLLLALFNLNVNTALMYILVDFFKIWYMLAQFFVTGLIALWNFTAYKFFIFK